MSNFGLRLLSESFTYMQPLSMFNTYLMHAVMQVNRSYLHVYCDFEFSGFPAKCVIKIIKGKIKRNILYLEIFCLMMRYYKLLMNTENASGDARELSLDFTQS